MSRWAESYLGGVAIQRIILARIKDPKASGKDIASLAQAYTDIEEMKRKIVGKPLPKPIDTAKAQPPKDLDVPSYSELMPEPPGQPLLPPPVDSN